MDAREKLALLAVGGVIVLLLLAVFGLTILFVNLTSQAVSEEAGEDAELDFWPLDGEEPSSPPGADPVSRPARPGKPPAAPVPEPPANPEIEALIRDLGAEEYRTRSRAEKRLVDLGLPALPYLEKALGSPDPEVKWRAREAMEQIEKKK
jgi:hypothetical protein